MFYKVTYNKRFRRANVYNNRCNFRCKICSYKLMKLCDSGLKIEEIKNVLEGLTRKSLIERVHFLGGEPTINPQLPELIEFSKELGLYTYLGHTNGSNIVDVDGANISIKAYTESIHIECTGVSNRQVLKNFVKAYNKGIKIKANSIFIPGCVDYEEIKEIAKFIADIDTNIPYHIVGYIPVPSAPWRKPTYEEVKKAAGIAKEYLKNVTFSCPDENFLHSKNDPRYKSVRIL